MCKDDKGSCITINCGCCGNGDNNTPVGTVISYMGTKAPEHYMICDGAELKIADYPQLVQQIRSEFEAVNYIGGDGTITFALPDLRNQFLRGFHGAATPLSNDIGVHQEPTSMPIYHWVPQGSYMDIYGDSLGTYSAISNADEKIAPTGSIIRMDIHGQQGSTGATTSFFTTRPTNAAVLYCIKYE
jgi:microcystin-dependent protein